MAEYLFAYLGGEPPASPEEGKAQMQRWHVWMEGLGEAMVNPGTPLGKSSFVSAAGVAEADGRTALSGFSIVAAESLDQALEFARQCPFAEIGTIEVAEMMQMPGGGG